jgi:hypothetical protein
MGLIKLLTGAAGKVTNLGQAAQDIAEVFTPSATRQMELSAEAQMAALKQLGEEYGQPAMGGFDRFINGMNRLPRPFLAFGTLALFVYAMIDPPQFAARMVGLNAVPEPLWWLLGAIVAFYFGARETWYFRHRGASVPAAGASTAAAEPNAALSDWRGPGGEQAG